jgi:hypothetical protein
VTRTAIPDPKRSTAPEPLYEVDTQTGASVEVFYADRALAISFGIHGPGWYSWSCQRGSLPAGPPNGPFATSYAAYGQMAALTAPLADFGKRGG